MSISILQGNGLKNGDTITIRNVDVEAVGNFTELGDTPNSYDDGKYLQSTTSGIVYVTLDQYATDEELEDAVEILDDAITTASGYLVELITDVDDKITTTSGYLDNRIDNIVVGSVNWETLTGKPDTFTPSNHGNESHSETYATEDYVDTAVSGVDWDSIQNKPEEFPPQAHDHSNVYQPAGDYATSAELTSVSGVIVSQIPTDYFTQSEVTTISGNIVAQIPVDYYTTGEVDSLVASASGTTDHSALDNLDYASSGHTGFQPAGEYITSSELTTVSGNIVSQIPTDFYTTNEVDTISGALNSKINGKQDAGDYATNGELATVSGVIVSQIPTDYYTTGQVNTISGALNTKINTKSDATHNHDTDYLSLTGGTIDGNLVVTGDVIVSGTEFIVEVEEVLIEDHLLTINYGEVGAGISFPYAGIEVDRGSEDNYLFVFDETDDNFQIGISGSLQPVATREDTPTDGYVPYWDAATYQFKTAGSKAITDLVTTSNLTTASGAIVAQIPTDYYTQSQVDTISGSLQDQIDNLDPLPDQSGNSGKYLYTDGSSASWEEVSGGSSLPDQTDNEGKVLTTDGSDPSWSDIDDILPEGDSQRMLIKNSSGELEWKQGLEIIKTHKVDEYNPGVYDWLEVEIASEGMYFSEGWYDYSAVQYFRTGIGTSSSEYQVHIKTRRVQDLFGTPPDDDIQEFYIEESRSNISGRTDRKIKFPNNYEGIDFIPGISINTGQIITEFSTDGDLTDDSDEKVPTQAAVKAYVDNNAGGLPDQSGNSGKYLTTDGSDASWSEVDALPDQSGYAGMVLTTNGSDAFWTTISGVTISGSELVNDYSPQLGGDLDLNGHYIEYDPTPTSSGTGSGEIATMTVDANSTGIGALLYIASDGNLEEADASADTTMPGFALALETGTGSKKVLLRGFMRDDSWDWTPGGTLYASETAGAMTQTAPTTSEAQVQVLGIATHADRVWFNPSYGTVEVA